MSDHELIAWAHAHTSGVMRSSVALAVLRLVEERDHARRVADGLAERCAGQSEILSRLAEKGPVPS